MCSRSVTCSRTRSGRCSATRRANSRSAHAPQAVTRAPIGEQVPSCRLQLAIIERPALVERSAVAEVRRVEGSGGDEVGKSQALTRHVDQSRAEFGDCQVDLLDSLPAGAKRVRSASRGFESHIKPLANSQSRVFGGSAQVSADTSIYIDRTLWRRSVAGLPSCRASAPRRKDLSVRLRPAVDDHPRGRPDGRSGPCSLERLPGVVGKRDSHPPRAGAGRISAA
jgi:hypothetical protein